MFNDLKLNTCGHSNFDIDGLCPDCRKREYDTGKCARCGKPVPENTTGWWIAGFDGYTDKAHYCPSCIIKYNEEYLEKQKEIEELERELPIIEAEYAALPEECSIYESEGEYYYSGYESPSFSEFQKELEYYKAHKDEVKAQRKKEYILREKIKEMKNRIEQKSWGGLMRANR